METAPIPARTLLTAVLLAVGSELTTGETRDTNSGDLARSLSEAGVDVAWISALPDRLGTVTAALSDALGRGPGHHDRRSRSHAGRSDP
jgi:Predicted nucleotide-utilizing enzyme related to molybdopterin-biosynthesis enzyme MoeA